MPAYPRTPGIAGCTTLSKATSFARASAASGPSAIAEPAPRRRKSRLFRYTDFGVISAMALHCTRQPSTRLRFRGLGLAHDGRHRRGQGLRLLGRRRNRLALVPRVPAVARRPLLFGGQLGPVLVADEARPRTARTVGAALDAAAHVERAARPRRLGRKPHDALRGHRRGQLAFRRQPAVALEDALLLGGGK